MKILFLNVHNSNTIFTIAAVPKVIILAAACVSSCGIIAITSIFTRPYNLANSIK